MAARAANIPDVPFPARSGGKKNQFSPSSKNMLKSSSLRMILSKVSGNLYSVSVIFPTTQTPYPYH
jgi:hypothetical protein